VAKGWFFHSPQHKLAGQGIKSKLSGIAKKGMQLGAGAFTGITAAGLVSGLSQAEMQNAELISAIPMEARIAILAAELGGMYLGYKAMGAIEKKFAIGKSLSEREKELVEIIKKKYNEKRFSAPNPFGYGG
jgi:hypothetical protein